jgi:hypothetical protein
MSRTRCLDIDQLVLIQHRRRFSLARLFVVVASSMRRSASRAGIIDIDLHQETVQLRFGQGVRAFLFDRVLRGKHVERLGTVGGS